MSGDAPIDWLGTPAAATYLGLTQRTIYKLVDTGHLRGYKFGRVIRFRRADLDAYLEESVIHPGDLKHLHPNAQPTGKRKPPAAS